MFKILLALHLVFAVFAVGPLVHAATTASRGIRRADSAATASSVRMLRIYAAASVLVIVFGFALMSVKRSTFSRGAFGRPGVLQGGGTVTVHGRSMVLHGVSASTTVAQFSDLWIWLSLVLWAVAIAVVMLLLVPTLQKATSTLAADGSVAALTARVAAGGGIVAALFLAIVFLMVYRP